MTEKEAIEKSLEHWRENLSKVKALRKKDIKKREVNIVLSPLLLAYMIFEIEIDGAHCPLCKFHENTCGKCVLWDKYSNEDTCCTEWRAVYACLCGMSGNITTKQIVGLTDAIGSMVKRLERELEVYDERTFDTKSTEADSTGQV